MEPSALINLARQFETLNAQENIPSKPTKTSTIFLSVDKGGSLSVEKRPGFLKRIFSVLIGKSYQFTTCAQKLKGMLENVPLTVQKEDALKIKALASWYENQLDTYRDRQNNPGLFAKLFHQPIPEHTLNELRIRTAPPTPTGTSAHKAQAAAEKVIIPPSKKPSSASLSPESLSLDTLPEKLEPKKISTYVGENSESLQSSLRGTGRATAQIPVGPKKTTAKLKIGPSGEVSVRKEVAHGGFKTIFFKAIHSGTTWNISAYLKIKDAAKTEKSKAEIEKELRCSSILEEKKAQHVVFLRRVTSRKDPSKTKGALAEFCELGTITERAEIPPSAADLKQRKDLAIQMAQAVKEMHDAKICHLDIKPDNFLLKMKNGKIWVGITDFGLSEILEEPSSDAHLLGSFRGTLNYAAPEVLALRRKGKRPPSPPIDPAMDMFSFGLVLLELFHGKGSLIIITTDTNQKIRGFSTIRSSLDRKNPTDAIILDLIDNTPSNRPTAEATLRRLQALPC